MRRVRVLLVDDSPRQRLLLGQILHDDPRIEIIGMVDDGQAAVDFIADGTRRPDVVLMDIHMPRLNGFEATRLIMERHPVPIVICTATADPREMQVTFRSMEAGAVACVEKPGSPSHPEFEKRAEHLRRTVRLTSEVKVVRRPARPRTGTRLAAADPVLPARRRVQRIVGIGASTGGPPVLQTILSSLPSDFGAPLIIVQHIARGFLPGMVEWLNQTTRLQVHIAAVGNIPQPGHAYIAPDDHHLGVNTVGGLVLSHEPREHCVRPSASWLFRSLARNWGSNAIGVLLTGMGKDGAAELKQMRDAGGLTIVQDRKSSVVHGMPGEAIALGAAMHVLPADRIADALVAAVKRRSAFAGGES